MSHRILITAKPMRALWPQSSDLRARFPADYVLAGDDFAETLELLPSCDAWIADVEEINARVLEIGRAGRLRVLVRWGVGMDNVDQRAAAALGIRVDRTAGVFSDEVADLGMGYMIALARQMVAVDRAVRAGKWPRPPGVSLRGKIAGVVGYGSIGRNLVKKLEAFGLQRVVYSRHGGASTPSAAEQPLFRNWPDGLDELDFLFLVCALTEQNRGLISAEVLRRLPATAYLINLGRGALMDETALTAALQSGEIAGAALDVYREEPLPAHSPLRAMKNVILGTHNASNTREGAMRASALAVQRVLEALETTK